MQKIQVLIAATEPVFCEGLRCVITREEDMEVVGIAQTGEQTVDAVRQLEPDVAITEVRLPGLNGVELIKKIKEASPHTAILALTRKPSTPCVLAAVEAGLAGYLLKSAAISQIILAVRGIYHGEAMINLTLLRHLAHEHINPYTDRQSNEDVWLSFRELQVLKLASTGLTMKDMGQRLSLSPRTIQAHMASIFRKFEVGTRTEALVCALKTGWLIGDDL